MHVLDPATNVTYVLVRADIFAKMIADDDDVDCRATYPFVDAVMRDDDVRDPTLASYQTSAVAS